MLIRFMYYFMVSQFLVSTPHSTLSRQLLSLCKISVYHITTTSGTLHTAVIFCNQSTINGTFLLGHISHHHSTSSQKHNKINSTKNKQTNTQNCNQDES